MSLNIITIGSAFYGNMTDTNLYQCSIDNNLYKEFKNINCYHFDEKFKYNGIPKYMDKKYTIINKKIFNTDLDPNEVDIYYLHTDNIKHFFYCCNINNRKYLLDIIKEEIEKENYIIIKLFTGQIFYNEAIKFLELDNIYYDKLNIICNGCYTYLDNPENSNYIFNEKFYSIYFYEKGNNSELYNTVIMMGSNKNFCKGVQYYLSIDLENGGMIATYLSILNSSNNDMKIISYLKNIERDYVIKDYNGDNLKEYIYKKLKNIMCYLNVFINIHDNKYNYIKTTINNYKLLNNIV
jgi:hypothetical protein